MWWTPGSAAARPRPDAELDPDATGPIGMSASVRMTAEMPRVPLPAIPEDVPARAEYVPADEVTEPGTAADGSAR